MSDKPDNPQAFPTYIPPYSCLDPYDQPGLTMRDYFAASDAAGRFAKWKLNNMTVGQLDEEYGDFDVPYAAAFSAFCFEFADAMLKQRSTTPTPNPI